MTLEKAIEISRMQLKLLQDLFLSILFTLFVKISDDLKFSDQSLKVNLFLRQFTILNNSFKVTNKPHSFQVDSTCSGVECANQTSLSKKCSILFLHDRFEFIRTRLEFIDGNIHVKKLHFIQLR